MDCALLILLFSVSAGGRKGSVVSKGQPGSPRRGRKWSTFFVWGEVQGAFPLNLSVAESATELHLKGPEG